VLITAACGVQLPISSSDEVPLPDYVTNLSPPSDQPSEPFDPLYQAPGHLPSFDHLSLQEGLSQSVVTSMVQDHAGFMWFGTQDGLNRYDGYEFKIYKNDPEDPSSLSLNYINVVYEDSFGTLWIGTHGGGLNQFDRESDSFIRWTYQSDDPNRLGSSIVNAIIEDGSGRLWIGTDENGLYRFDVATDEVTPFLHDPQDPSSIPSDTVSAIVEDHDGALWVGLKQDGLARFDPASETFTYYSGDSEEPKSPISEEISVQLIDRFNNLWIGTHGDGLYKRLGLTGEYIHYLKTKTGSSGSGPMAAGSTSLTPPWVTSSIFTTIL
jgi:ligand-binding sensor domain-containing protein